MTIPVESKTFQFTSKCLEGIDGAPSFTIRYGTRRDRHAYEDELAAQRLPSNYEAEDFQEAYLTALKNDWSKDKDAADKMIDAVERYYSADAAFAEQTEVWKVQARAILADVPEEDWSKEEHTKKLPPTPRFDFDPKEELMVKLQLDKVKEHSEIIGHMHRCNIRRDRMLKRIMISILVEAASLDVELTRNRDGILTDESLDALQDALEQYTIRRLPDAPSWLPFNQLYEAAILGMRVTGDEEKNSESPPLISSSPNGLIASEETDTLSPSPMEASALSPAIPEGLSAEATPNS